MGDKLKKAAPWLAGFILIWYAHGAVGAGAGRGPRMKESLLLLPHDLLKQQPDPAPAPFENDPFFIEWSPYGPTYDPVYIAARKREAEDREKAAKAEAVRQQLAAREAQKKQEEAARAARIKADAERRKQAEAEAPGGALGFEPFYLTLDSVLATSRFATARVSGHTVEVGGALKALDPRKPPKVEEIRGTRVVVVHRGKRYVLDLLGTTQIAVGGVPKSAPASAAAAPRRATGATRGPKKSAVGGGGRKRRPGSLKKPPKKSAVSGG